MSCRMKKGPVVNFIGCNSIQGSKRILEVSDDARRRVICRRSWPIVGGNRAGSFIHEMSDQGLAHSLKEFPDCLYYTSITRTVCFVCRLRYGNLVA